MVDIKEILRLHSDWLQADPRGKKADLSHSDLSDSDLSHSDLSHGGLSHCDLRCCDLSHSDLSHSDLRYCDLRYCDLSGCNLCYCDLRYSNLRRCNLSGCNLCGSSLGHCNLDHCNLCGSIINWGSHDLVSHILLSHAAGDVEKHKLAGCIFVSRDWCWRKFLSLGDPLTEWALSVLRQYVTPGNPLPLED